VNPQSGKTERVFVDLAAVYPTPDEPGSELSFEEVWAANRGWLDQSWVPVDDVAEETDDSVQQVVLQDINPPQIEDPSTREPPQKLVVHHETVMLDENGAIMGKNKKKKVMEVNETQISRSPRQFSSIALLTFCSQSKIGLSFWSKDPEEEHR
jgi:checkpoint serine/threonine-protein kinase